VTIGGETKYICGCGLSNTRPFCNGTHKISHEENPDKLYWYNEQGNRFETPDRFPGYSLYKRVNPEATTRAASCRHTDVVSHDRVPRRPRRQPAPPVQTHFGTGRRRHVRTGA
jgi:hypothetical protein